MKLRAFAAILTLFLTLALALHVFVAFERATKVRKLSENGAATVVSARDIRDAISAQPLEPANVHALYVLRRDTERATADAVLSHLARMGYRYSPALLSQLVPLIERGDVDGSLRLADALMRRGRGRESVFVFLQALERIPANRAAMAAALCRQPPWANDYLLRLPDAADAKFINIRRALLEDLRPCGALTSNAFYPLIDAHLNRGQSAEAYALFQMSVAARGESIPPTGIYDPEFVDLGNRLKSRTRRTVFEWHILGGSEVRVQAFRRGIRFSWAGSSAPLLQQHAMIAGQSRPFELVAENLSEHATFTLKGRCLGSNMQGESLGRREGDVVRFASPVPAACSLVRLDLIGHSELARRSEAILLSFRET